MTYEMDCSHIDTCMSCFLNDHHNRDGELLLGVFVDGASTFHDVLWALIDELQTASASIDPADVPGWDYDAAKACAKSLFAETDLSKPFDVGLDMPSEDDDCAESVQAWFLFTWEKED